MIRVYFVIICLTAMSVSRAQGSIYKWSVFTAGSYAIIDVPNRPDPNYGSWELKIGGQVARSFKKNPHFALKSGLHLGMKFKRDSYYFNDRTATRYPDVLSRIDITVSETNHYFLEIPLTFELKPKINSNQFFDIGIMFRSFNGTDIPQDVLSAFQEIGLYGGISSIIFSKLYMSATGYYGFTNMYFGSILSPGGVQSPSNVTNRYIQFSLGHKI